MEGVLQEIRKCLHLVAAGRPWPRPTRRLYPNPNSQSTRTQVPPWCPVATHSTKSAVSLCFLMSPTQSLNQHCNGVIRGAEIKCVTHSLTKQNQGHLKSPAMYGQLVETVWFEDGTQHGGRVNMRRRKPDTGRSTRTVGRIEGVFRPCTTFPSKH